MKLWLADTSMVVPTVLTSHDAHITVNSWIGDRTLRLPVHAQLEAYSVLTRLPGDARLKPADAAALLLDRFGAPIALPPASAVGLVGELAHIGIAGGAVYDALIAVTCRSVEGTLLTRDRRAAATYAALHVAHEIVG